MRASMGTGRYVASEDDITMGPYTAWAEPTTHTGAIWFHGYNTGGTSWSEYGNGSGATVRAIGERFPTISPDLGGLSTWGNATGIARTASAKTYLQGASSPCRAKAGKVLLLAGSMGFLNAASYARANPSAVAAIIGVVPAIDLNDIVTNNRGGYASVVNTAYGGTYSNTTDGPTHSPALFAAQLTMPIKIWYATGDTIAVPAAATAFGAAAPDCELVSMAGTHGAPTFPATYLTDLVEFFEDHTP